MKTNKNLEDLLKSAIQDSLATYGASNDGNYIGDLYIYYNEENQSLTFFDDMEQELLCILLSENSIQFQTNPLKEIKYASGKVLKELVNEKAFDKEYIYKPFTVDLVDEDFTILEELIFIDDDTLKLDNELWNDLDKDLDDFFNDLMK
ncbi:MAG: hypothetical protein LIO93_11855 [Bacteroidales bacterium]|nr:hypothetical protein [Bacteroidales bacterium]